MNLNRINSVENKYGNIAKLAEDLLNERMPEAMIDDILQMLGNCPEMWEEGMSHSDQLKSLILDILEPLDEIGSLMLGEEIAA